MLMIKSCLDLADLLAVEKQLEIYANSFHDFTLDRAEREDLKSRFGLILSPFLFPPKKKREEEKENL